MLQCILVIPSTLEASGNGSLLRSSLKDFKGFGIYLAQLYFLPRQCQTLDSVPDTEIKKKINLIKDWQGREILEIKN